MKKIIIGIVSKISIDNDNIPIEYISDEYRMAILKYGGIPLMLLPSGKINDLKLSDEEIKNLNYQIDLCDGILFPGGHNWNYYEEYIFKYGMKKNMPMLGICCGMQMMAYLDVKQNTIKNSTKINHNQKDKNYVHSINIKKDTMLREIIKQEKILVNSRHNEHIEKLKKFKISAISEDGIIEAIEYKNILGIQWHPESMLNYDIFANKIYQYFINKCK